MSVAHPATTPPLISTLQQKIDLEDPGDATDLQLNAQRTLDELNQHIAKWQPTIKAIWDLNNTNGTGEPYCLHRLDHPEGFNRLRRAYDGLPEFKDAHHRYYELFHANRKAWEELAAHRERQRQHNILRNVLATLEEQEP